MAVYVYKKIAFSMWSLISELRQYHPKLRVSRVKDLPSKGFFIIAVTDIVMNF